MTLSDHDVARDARYVAGREEMLDARRRLEEANERLVKLLQDFKTYGAKRELVPQNHQDVLKAQRQGCGLSAQHADRDAHEFFFARVHRRILSVLRIAFKECRR